MRVPGAVAAVERDDGVGEDDEDAEGDEGRDDECLLGKLRQVSVLLSILFYCIQDCGRPGSALHRSLPIGRCFRTWFALDMVTGLGRFGGLEGSEP